LFETRSWNQRAEYKAADDVNKQGNSGREARSRFRDFALELLKLLEQEIRRAFHDVIKQRNPDHGVADAKHFSGVGAWIHISIT